MEKNMNQLGLTRKSHNHENHEIMKSDSIKKLNSQPI